MFKFRKIIHMIKLKKDVKLLMHGESFQKFLKTSIFFHSYVYLTASELDKG